MKICPVNQDSIIVYFSDTVNAQTAEIVFAANSAIKSNLAHYVIDTIPSYTSILITINLLEISLHDFRQKLASTLNNPHTNLSKKQVKKIELPVYYGREVALDADEICDHTGLTFEQAIHLHASTQYRVYAIGFAPGFAYLGQTNQQLEVPRKQTPRMAVPAGSLAIADRQTAIYPKSSPGGWHIIGRTPVKLIDFEKQSLSVFEMGALVSFVPIDKATFVQMGGTFLPNEIE